MVMPRAPFTPGSRPSVKPSTICAAGLGKHYCSNPSFLSSYQQGLSFLHKHHIVHHVGLFPALYGPKTSHLTCLCRTSRSTCNILVKPLWRLHRQPFKQTCDEKAPTWTATWCGVCHHGLRHLHDIAHPPRHVKNVGFPVPCLGLADNLKTNLATPCRANSTITQKRAPNRRHPASNANGALPQHLTHIVRMFAPLSNGSNDDA
ncbi:hypothetical protein JB92DRAFT_2977406 [Gautieria morchelliformis]|nr:hypothetical protein JB92DRAFT_2977406 [Gautieria morchelliformis]